MTHKNLAVQSEAISLYLDSLLMDVDDDEPQENSSHLEEAPPLEPQVVVKPAPEAEITEPRQTSLQLEAQPDAIIPAWANGPFQAMLFKVGELSLALPLQELVSVVEWQDISTISEASGIQLGTYQFNDQTVPVVDIAQLVLPAERLNVLVGDRPQERISRIVIIQDGQWGLACDSVHELITFQPEKVRWHTARTQRQWLAGTSVELMCALLDTKGLVAMLEAAIKV